MNSEAPLTSLHLLDLHRKFRGSKLTETAPAPDAEQERLLKKKDSQDSPKRKRERQEGKGGKNSQSQSQAGAEAEEEALQICEKDRVGLRWERDRLQKELETCEKKVDELQDKLDAPEYLFAQQADLCKMGLNEEGQFYLESSQFLPVTEAFTDRPLQLEKSIPTSYWFPKGFNERFENSEDGWPNSAIALVDDGVSQGIYVSAFVTAYAKEDGTLGYFLQQSPEQAAVKSLEDLLPSDSTETTKDHCSLFIDDGTCTGIGPDCYPWDQTCDTDDGTNCYYEEDGAHCMCREDNMRWEPNGFNNSPERYPTRLGGTYPDYGDVTGKDSRFQEPFYTCWRSCDGDNGNCWTVSSAWGSDSYYGSSLQRFCMPDGNWEALMFGSGMGTSADCVSADQCHISSQIIPSLFTFDHIVQCNNELNDRCPQP